MQQPQPIGPGDLKGEHTPWILEPPRIASRITDLHPLLDVELIERQHLLDTRASQVDLQTRVLAFNRVPDGCDAKGISPDRRRLNIRHRKSVGSRASNGCAVEIPLVVKLGQLIARIMARIHTIDMTIAANRNRDGSIYRI